MTDSFNIPVIQETEASPIAPGGETAKTDAEWSRLEKMMRKQMRNFVNLLSRVLADEDPDAVHDLRVCTRRLQQILAAVTPAKGPGKARSVRRTLRLTRHALGDWRDCDVALHRITRVERRTASQYRRRGWELVHEAVATRRKHAINKARRRLLKADGFTLSNRVRQLLALPADRLGNVNPGLTVRAAVADAARGWRTALAQAAQDHSVQSTHALRIQMKRLRYRVELARDMGADEAGPVINWFKSLQDRLGNWHDRHELNTYITQALARPNVLLDEARVALEMLKEVERNDAFGRREAEEFFRLASESEGRAALDAWLEAYCATPEQPPAATIDGIQPVAAQPEQPPPGAQPEQEAGKPDQ